MKRLDVNVTDNVHEVLEYLKRKTERSKTELIHDALALLWFTANVYDSGHALAEVDPETLNVISRFSMPIFEGPRASADFAAVDLREETARLSASIAARLRDIESGATVPRATLQEGEKTLTRLLERWKTLAESAPTTG